MDGPAGDRCGLGRPSPPPGEPRATHVIPIDALAPSDSPRLAGEDMAHTRLLAETETTLPPISVHRPTMRVIDGMHRVRAALLRGVTEIDVQFFDGTEDDAFILAVQANTSYGLPLSVADRMAAASRILSRNPEMSDRSIAAVTGLARTTIAGVRSRATGREVHLNSRIGLDGRRRPVDSTAGRRMAGQLLRSDPRASLRTVARAAGISPGTVRDVRQRLSRGEDPVPERSRGGGRPDPVPPARSARARKPAVTSAAHAHTRSVPGRDVASVMVFLRRDPSLRMSDAGRTLLRFLDAHRVDPDWDSVLDRLPAHALGPLAELVRGCAEELRQLSEQIERRSKRIA